MEVKTKKEVEVTIKLNYEETVWLFSLLNLGCGYNWDIDSDRNLFGKKLQTELNEKVFK